SQRHWQHALPPRARVQHERINLTFRVIRPA
ncbi:MAG: alpha-ketoglutarate-dependent dioxygenase AlkB, partial [Cyanobacteria bacterium K_DeepCast_0m_m1_088]|nr:alpha-ketoglutarate-dependent dioxygenase AlkB [Cyanobacteria bacterium K_DeepCast_0m_m1_088]